MLSEMIRGHAAAWPDRAAIVCGDDCVRYGELADRTAALAGALRARGIGRDSLVAVDLGRNSDTIVAMLAVMQAGAAYTVVERGPDRDGDLVRLGELNADCVVSSDTDIVPRLDPSAVDGAGEVGHPVISEDDVAYVLYTSGSTGAPKGVMVTHGNLAHYVTAVLDRLGIARSLSYAHVSSLSADLGNTCVYLALWSGGTLHLVDDETRRDPAALLRYLRAESIDFLKITPSHWSAVLRAARTGRPRLGHLVLGGEALAPSLVRRTLSAGVAAVVVNHYGPTETTIGVCAHTVTAPVVSAGSVPIGKPLGRTRFLVRDSNGAYRQTGEGELYVAGPQVARGYRGAPEATAAAFVDIDGVGRCYRTGDMVRIGEDGTTWFLGRRDRQVKLDGHRVELDHVESVIAALGGVRDVAVHAAASDNGGILAAAVTVDEALTAQDVRDRLKQQAPGHLVPSRIELLPELPRTSNGKIDRGAVERLFRTEVVEPAADGPAGIRWLWAKCLGHDDFTEHDDFFACGGTSLDAIRVVAELQARGLRVTAREFQARPTIAALAELSVPDVTRPAPARHPVQRVFAPAQRDFLAAGMAEPDYWNQVIALEAEDVDAAVLADSVHDLVAAHSMLHTAFRRVDGRWEAHTVPARDVFGVSTVDTVVPGAVHEIARKLHAGIDLAGGAVFKAHLVSADRGSDQIVLVCHHLCVDAVSWRIVIDDLVRAYVARLRGTWPPAPRRSVQFWDWVRHVDPQMLRSDLGYWRSVLPRLRESSTPEQGKHLERDARTVWLAFSPAETSQLMREAGPRLGAAPHVALLGAFGHVLAGHEAAGRMVVNVESHGRTILDDDLDVSPVVGWFTSTYPLELVSRGDADVAGTIKDLGAVLDAVPGLGEAYGWLATELEPRPVARFTYNYVGRFGFSRNDGLVLRPSTQPVGPARGPGNDRGTDLKLTARIVADQLVLDLSGTELEGLEHILPETRRRLLGLLGDSSPAPSRWLVEPGSSTGLLVYVPTALMQPAEPRPVRSYERILLTGATGYVGVHLLHALLTRTRAHIHCLVRDRFGAAAGHRLNTAYRWHFPGRDLGEYDGRCTVLPGDAGKERFGLPAESADVLAQEIDAIYHVASDTRLFGDGESITTTNIGSTRNVIQFARTGRSKDLHYVSSLAVCGVNPAPEPAPFAEDDLDFGQRFENDYESSKFACERLVREFDAWEGGGFVYRLGNVTGHSVTGRFQRNGGDNRLVQFLQAAVKVGRLPRNLGDDIVLSPVDTVVDGILALSTDPDTRGGTFHVEGEHAIAYREVFAVLSELGFRFEPDPAEDFDELFERHAGDDIDIALGLFWARRGQRNVRFDHSRSRLRLHRLGVKFHRLDPDWLRRYLTHLVRTGALDGPIGSTDGTGEDRGGNGRVVGHRAGDGAAVRR
ncbi:AMP-binding protein [Amycolatopsis sp. H6(2020)]|nr:AMP-binding protein [Amycolatopsis sp. H6(2020)]